VNSDSFHFALSEYSAAWLWPPSVGRRQTEHTKKHPKKQQRQQRNKKTTVSSPAKNRHPRPQHTQNTRKTTTNHKHHIPHYTNPQTPPTTTTRTTRSRRRGTSPSSMRAISLRVTKEDRVPMDKCRRSNRRIAVKENKQHDNFQAKPMRAPRSKCRPESTSRTGI